MNFPRLINLFCFCCVFTCLLFPLMGNSQQARVTITDQSFLTYPFSDPSPVAAFAFKPDIYPYHKFEGYALEGQEKQWKVVLLENEHLKVSITPEIGGRVWGAIEKSTGDDFIYQNEVVKFRNIAMRGPWTSGGIEFNFGIIGHAPSTATPVDYHIEEHEDGSVTCVVGTIDLPSRTQWRVRIKLEKDKAYFTTEGLWYNPSPYRQPYYNWMTAAAHVGDDLEFFYPGHIALQHSGALMDWPIQEGKNVSLYANNQFGGSKSHHMAGSFQNHFGGYFHEKGGGFGHFSNFDDMPGKKLWLWALSRSGGIWEDLLTDASGQYMEFQAGRLLNQFQPSARQETPLSKAAFTPLGVDKWTNYWFPVKGIGGISAAVEQGVFFIQYENPHLNVNFNPFQPIDGSLEVLVNGTLVENLPVSLKPMDEFSHQLNLETIPEKVSILYKGEVLFEWADKDPYQLNRQYEAKSVTDASGNQQSYYEARQAYHSRDYKLARQLYEDLLSKEPNYQQALIDFAELLVRQHEPQRAETYIHKALSNDFYDPQANFVAAVLYSSQSQYLDALEAFGWASRSMEYRSASYTKMAEIHLRRKNLSKALEFAQKALDYNVHNLMALQVKASTYRMMDEKAKAQETLKTILEIDPLHHWAKFEQVLLGTRESHDFSNGITNEFPFQTYLEIASVYQQYGMEDECKSILKAGPDHPLIHLWLAHWDNENETTHLKAFTETPIAMVFPFREETLTLLENYAEKHPHWKMDYYLSLNLLAMGQDDRAVSLLHQIQGDITDPNFYLNRALLITDVPAYNPISDLERAKQLDPDHWRSWHFLGKQYEKTGENEKLYELLSEAKDRFKGNYVIEMDWVRSLAQREEYTRALSVLKDIEVLPYEGAGEGRMLYENLLLNASIKDISSKKWGAALEKIKHSRDWPENLGVGKPYDPDERIQDFMEALIYRLRGNQRRAKQALEAMTDLAPNLVNRPQTVLNILALHYLGRSEEVEHLQESISSPTLLESLEKMLQGDEPKALPLSHPYPILVKIIKEWDKLD